MAKLALTLASSPYEHVRDFTEGEIEAEGIDLNYLNIQIEEMFHRFINFREFDVSEISSGKYTSMISQGDKRFVGIPVFPSRVFRQSSVYVKRGSKIRKAEDLAGKKVGIPEWGQSAAVYSRGWLVHDVGIPLKDIHWVQAGVGMAGRKEKVKLKLPKGVKLTPVSDKSLQEMLLSGEIDAMLSAHPPPLVEAGDPRIQRLYKNYRKVEEDYYKRTGVWPIMHLYAIRREVFDAHPWVAQSLMKAFTQAKDQALHRATEITACRFPFAWCYDAAEKAKALFGDDFYPYGIEANRTTLDAFLQYGFEQGLFHKRMEPEDLFPKEVQSRFKV
jgi:4,5-dihydroxyphthalate decarboxylase